MVFGRSTIASNIHGFCLAFCLFLLILRNHPIHIWRLITPVGFAQLGWFEAKQVRAADGKCGIFAEAVAGVIFRRCTVVDALLIHQLSLLGAPHVPLVSQARY